MTRFAAGPADSPGFLMWHATLRWQRTMTAALAPFGLTHVQFVLLACAWWLNSRGEEPTQLALATQAGTDVKMTSQVVRTLESRGWLLREIDATDARARALRVTPKGVALAKRAVKAVEAADDEFFANTARPSFVKALRTLGQD